MGRLVILSGPSCVGKGPLYAALKKFYPHIAGRLSRFVLYDSRAPRPGEVDGIDYHFRCRDEIEALREQPHIHVFSVRNDLQAMDTQELERSLAASDVFFEGNPFIGSGLIEFVRTRGVSSLSVFLSPLTGEEIVELKGRAPTVSVPEFVTDVMRRKLLRRTKRQKGILSREDLENIEVRAQSAHSEMQQAWRFDHVIACHDGEDSENWDAFYHPIGDARRAVQAFAALLEGNRPDGVETWGPDIIG
ncbi:MAG: hypothetical protein QM570_12535 [Planctomycetota bacterium]|nr:hypothetical protein [Planctomycetota bacterium]